MFASKVKQTILISTMLFPLQAIGLDELQEPLLHQHGIRLSVLRLDKIHPIASGNKLFKLHYFLQEALKEQLPIVTYGGAYSNHLVATAYACRQLGIGCSAVVRGEKPEVLSHTLQACEAFGMQLDFVSRSVYTDVAAAPVASRALINVPEGGYHPDGAKGAALILESLPHNNFSHICTATGTATTLSGLLIAASPVQKVLSFSALKGMNDMHERLQFLTAKKRFDNLELMNDYHFGGYAKKSNELLSFMNELYRQHDLSTDFVYTGKMMFGVFDQIKKGRFEAGSHILCIHTGGLQGNQSLPAGTLCF